MSNHKILVFGKKGQVASALQELLPSATFLSSSEADFLHPQEVLEKLNEIKPQIVINASAYTLVDKAEDEKDKCLMINAKTPGLIAEWCAQNKVALIHYSTDYVFSGEGSRPWVETDTTDPVNYYGQSKLAGEKAILAQNAQSYILRISWVHSPWGSNFPKTILRLAKEREELKIVNDQWGAPTDARDVAQVTVNLAEQIQKKIAPKAGIYHLKFSDYITWYEFAKQTVENAKNAGEDIKVKNILPITSEEFPTKAKRPKNSRLGSLYKESFTLLRNK